MWHVCLDLRLESILGWLRIARVQCQGSCRTWVGRCAVPGLNVHQVASKNYTAYVLPRSPAAPPPLSRNSSSEKNHEPQQWQQGTLRGLDHDIIRHASHKAVMLVPYISELPHFVGARDAPCPFSRHSQRPARFERCLADKLVCSECPRWMCRSKALSTTEQV